MQELTVTTKLLHRMANLLGVLQSEVSHLESHVGAEGRESYEAIRTVTEHMVAQFEQLRREVREAAAEAAKAK